MYLHIFIMYTIPSQNEFAIYNAEYILLPLHTYNNIISLFQMGSCYILSQYIHMYI